MLRPYLGVLCAPYGQCIVCFDTERKWSLIANIWLKGTSALPTGYSLHSPVANGDYIFIWGYKSTDNCIYRTAATHTGGFTRVASIDPKARLNRSGEAVGNEVWWIDESSTYGDGCWRITAIDVNTYAIRTVETIPLPWPGGPYGLCASHPYYIWAQDSGTKKMMGWNGAAWAEIGPAFPLGTTIGFMGILRHNDF
jgi:hypothetical protein